MVHFTDSLAHFLFVYNYSKVIEDKPKHSFSLLQYSITIGQIKRETVTSIMPMPWYGMMRMMIA